MLIPQRVAARDALPEKQALHALRLVSLLVALRLRLVWCVPSRI
jgi:hypothetical protein